jgi:release factor glutamine methyltransferase
MTTFADAVRRAAEILAAAGVDDPRLDARLLVAEAAGVGPTMVFSRSETLLTVAQAACFDALLARRAAREPMSHVLGRRGFWSLTLEVTADTLAPRPDTETVVEAVLAELPDRTAPLRLLDFGTGTGAILLALLAELPGAVGTGIDASPGALRVAERNAAANGMAGRARFKLGDWGRGLDECFDVIVSNPPYIPDDDIAGLDPEVAMYEPRQALAGGPDGLDCYRALAPDIVRLLAPGGVAALEVGCGQADAVAGLMDKAGLSLRGFRRDIAGIDRCVVCGRR